MRGFGKAKFGSSRRTYFKLKDGESVFVSLDLLGTCRMMVSGLDTIISITAIGTLRVT